MANSELACVYAALILADDDVAVTPEKITTILKVEQFILCIHGSWKTLQLENSFDPLKKKRNVPCRLLVLMLSPTGPASSPR